MTSLDLCRGGGQHPCTQAPKGVYHVSEAKEPKHTVSPVPQSLQAMFSMAKIRTYCATYLRNGRKLHDFCKKGTKMGASAKVSVTYESKDLDRLLDNYGGRVLLQRWGGDFCFYQAQDFPGEPEWDSSIPLMEKPI